MVEDQTRSIELHVAAPISRLDDGRTIAELCPGQAHFVGRRAEMDREGLRRIAASCRTGALWGALRIVTRFSSHFAYQPVATPTNGFDLHRGARQGLAQDGNVVLQVVRLDAHVLPKAIDHVSLQLKAASPLDEQYQCVEDLVAQRDELVIPPKPSLPDLQAKSIKQVGDSAHRWPQYDRLGKKGRREGHVSTYSGHGDRLDRARLLRAIARAREAKVMTEDDGRTLVALVELVGGRLS